MLSAKRWGGAWAVGLDVSESETVGVDVDALLNDQKLLSVSIHYDSDGDIISPCQTCLDKSIKPGNCLWSARSLISS